ncbi:S-layer homology domain-containing protein [Ureibacillus aquaedulcis]|uniref:S-layer homology domain-containing protein n=1 Tax=Ureibacillus aquaedulcis TaxID=3058421 RepID=A0ABT8GQ07_9BACL|nr:S-layer homology domain-containing protein [Ureibacillus sp. BA0131]MDN4493498.1 S-layer homology domain-containing protein [Ureibacillus sp. BA0131]
MKGLYVFLTSLVVFGFSVTPALAAEKSIDLYYSDDVDYDHWAYDELERFLNADIVDGYVESEEFEEDGEVYEYSYVYLKPNNTITRAEFTKILVYAMNLNSDIPGKSFPDVKPTNWYYVPVKVASSLGIINGTPDGSFRPNDKITRAEITAMIYRAFGTTINFSGTGKVFSDVPQGNFAYEAIRKTAAVEIIKGYGDVFKPSNNATRAEAIVMIDRALHLQPGSDEDKLAVVQTVARNIQEEMTLTEQQDSKALEALYRDTTIGYYLAASLESLDTEDLIEDMDTTFTMEQVGEHSINPASVNKNFAQVRIEDLRYNMSMTAPDMSFNMTVDLSGTAYLKKSNDGKWKIYNIVYDEEANGENWEEVAASEIQ